MSNSVSIKTTFSFFKNQQSSFFAKLFCILAVVAKKMGISMMQQSEGSSFFSFLPSSSHMGESMKYTRTTRILHAVGRPTAPPANLIKGLLLHPHYPHSNY